MSNSTRQGGYDERLVVPLEASRRGAHRARTNPLVAALPLLAVVAVVAAVIGVTWALFLRGGGDQTAVGPLDAPTSPAATNSAPSTPAQPSGEATPSVTPSKTPSPSSGGISKSIAISVANGSGKAGLAGRVTAVVKGAGYTKAVTDRDPWQGSPVGETTVFYAKNSQAATAAAIVKAIGNGTAQLSPEDASNGAIVIVAYDEAG
jgi:hypothetical protein